MRINIRRKQDRGAEGNDEIIESNDEVGEGAKGAGQE